MINNIQTSFVCRQTELLPISPACGVDFASIIQFGDRTLSNLNHTIAEYLENNLGLTGTAISAAICTIIKISGLTSTIIFASLTAPIWIPFSILHCLNRDHLEPLPEESLVEEAPGSNLIPPASPLVDIKQILGELEGSFDVVMRSTHLESSVNYPVIILPEIHTSKDVKKDIGRLVSKLATEGPICVFIEGSESMKRIDMDFSDRLHIEIGPSSDITYYGWDDTATVSKTSRMAREQSALSDQFKQKREAAANESGDQLSNPKIQELEDLNAKVSEARASLLAELKTGMLARNLKLADTLKKIQEKRESGEFPERIVLISGAAHVLKTVVKYDYEVILTPVYDAMNQMNCVLLKSKNIDPKLLS